MRKILIQLIGEQTLPNIFPILSICPDSVVNIYTGKTRKQHSTIMNWCRKYGKQFHINPEFVQTPSVSTSLADIQMGIGKVLRQEMEKLRDAKDSMLILNMTGGTKSMSACAISFCMQISHRLKEEGYQPIPVVYLNPENREIEFITESANKSSVLVREPREVKLSVQQIIDAGGTAELVDARKDWKQVYPCAKAIQDIARKELYFTLKEVNQDNYAAYAGTALSELLRDNDSKRLEKARTALKKLAAEAQEDKELRHGYELCGFEPREGDFYFSAKLQKEVMTMEQKLADTNLQKWEMKELKKAMSRKLGTAANFFVGGWWEVVVANAYQMQNPQAEVLWSVETSTKNDAENKHKVETDIIATDGHSLCCISCKRGIHAQVTQELEQHCTRTAMLGGVIHQRIIAVFNRKAVYQLSSLARALHLTMWSDKEIRKLEKGQNVSVEPERDNSTSQITTPQQPVKECASESRALRLIRAAINLVLFRKLRG